MLKDLKEKFYKNPIIMLIAIIVIGIIATICIFRFSKDCNQAGTIGDTISGVFTALAFICAMFAVALQSKELSLQREELKQTREELEGQKKEFQIQNKTLKRQQFENTFFNMLKTQENIVSNIKLDTGKTARAAIKDMAEGFVIKIPKSLKEEEELIDLYQKEQFLFTLDHYFRHMYRIIKFVDETDFDSFADIEKAETNNDSKITEEKYKYVCILRATLSYEELVLLFYDALCYPKMKNLIIKYSFLQNIRCFYNTIQHFKYYDDYDFQAFGNRKEEIKKSINKIYDK